MTDSNEKNEQARYLLASSILPGLGNWIKGDRKSGYFFFFLFVIHSGILALGAVRGKLFWQGGPKNHWLFSIVALLAVFMSWSIPLFFLSGTPAEEKERNFFWKRTAASFLENKKALAGGSILLIVLYMALFAPAFSPHDPLKMDLLNTTASPSNAHYLGTDNFGRDILGRLIYGSRVALGIGVLATIFNMILGGVLGLVGGFFGGVVDSAIMRMLEAINAIPFIILAILVMSLFGPGALNLILVLGIFGLQPARIIRSKVLTIKEENYVEASQALGTSDTRIIFRHIFPNSMASLLVVATMKIGTNIITVAGLSFLGFGVKAPTPSWGAMLQQAQEFIRTAWWMAFFPGLAIFFTVLGFNILGDALRDILDPKLKRV